jgi:hypothetical protein
MKGRMRSSSPVSWIPKLHEAGSLEVRVASSTLAHKKRPVAGQGWRPCPATRGDVPAVTLVWHVKESHESSSVTA